MRPRGAVDHGHWAGLEYHHQLLDDPFRTDAYDRAIRALVTPGMRVLDLGCGTGILSLLAARCGATVHAVESTPIVHVARALAAANGLADRIVFHEADAESLEPQGPVDLVISDFMGRFVVDDQMLAAARQAGKWLVPGGRFCPSRLRLYLAPVQSRLRPWDVLSAGYLGLDLRAALPLVANSGWPANLGPTDLLGEPALYATVDPPHRVGPFDAHLRFTLRKGRLQALAGWFVADLAPGVVLSTEPGVETHWGQYLFVVPVGDVEDGDVLDVHVRYDEPGAEWHWDGTLTTRDGEQPFAYTSEPRDATRPLPAPTAPPRPEDAAALLDAQIAALPPDAPELAALYETLGVVRMNQGENGAAIRAFLRCLSVDPTRAAAKKWLPVAFERGGYPQAAARRFQARP